MSFFHRPRAPNELVKSVETDLAIIEEKKDAKAIEKAVKSLTKKAE